MKPGSGLLMLKHGIIFFLGLTIPYYCYGQINTNPVKDSLISNIIEQVVLFPQEKMYLQIDKPLYISGERIWFRAYSVDAVLHTPVTHQYVYVELINPLDSVVRRVKVRQDRGAFSGYIDLDQGLPDGDYTICAYTENMLNTGEDYFFRKYIRVAGPLSATVNTVVKFRAAKGDRLTAEVSFTDIRTHRKIRPEGLKMKINRQPLSEVEMEDDTVAYYTFRLPEGSAQRLFYVETKKSREFITVPFQEDDFEVYFYPEGGYLPDGVSSAVAFKALNSAGLPEMITGRIVDSVGNEYAYPETTHDGMGIFYLASEAGRTLYADCKNDRGREKRFELPAARRGICSIAAEAVSDTLYVTVLHSSETQEPKDLFLVLHTRGILHYAARWDPDYTTLAFNTGNFPSGILQILLLDGDMNPLSERLVFCRNDDQARVEFFTDRQNYEERQPVNSSVRITDSHGLPRESTFSVSVTDDNDIKPDTAVTIMTTLLLSSDLRGHINNPSFYFQQDNPSANLALDLLMMTNGWRRYNIPDVLTGKYQNPKYPAKYGMEITGKVKSLIRGKPIGKGTVAAFSWESGYYEETATDSAGCFVFNGIEFQDSAKFVIQALDRKGSDGVELLLDEDLFPRVTKLPVRIAMEIEDVKQEEQMSDYITKADTKYTLENGMRTIYIGEVIIKAKTPEEKDYSFSYYMPKVNQASNNIIDYTQIEEYHPTFLSEIINHIPFTRVENGKVVIERMSLSLNGTLYAVLIVDDMIIHDYDIDSFDPYSIERIAVLKGSQTSLLGGDGAGGAVVITLKKGYSGRAKIPKFNIKSFTPLGYQRPAEFYSPRYETREERETGPPDLRTTIYWNPNVKVPPSGEATFDFYSADTPTDYTVVIEGITSDGNIIHSRNRISRK